VSAPGLLAAVAGLLLVGLAAVLLVDKRRPLRHLNDQPHPQPRDLPGPYLGDGDHNRTTAEPSIPGGRR
jgi:hypothetical protein